LITVLVFSAVFAIGCTPEPVTTTQTVTSTTTATETITETVTRTTTFLPEPTIPNQTAEDLSVTEAYDMIQANIDNPDFVIIDVRTPEEYAISYIEGSALLDLNGGVFEVEVKALDRCTTYLLYCRSGNRSESAFELMKSLNFAEVYNMLGGIVEWEANGLPLVIP
jgi:rhodanese-related sulfurtransferase